ncbi:hypothetical protein J6590_100364 [Homalodisca vitripennis]|nr:hypothetical protein J6590_100364 [Homalodisca vitripennis]
MRVPPAEGASEARADVNERKTSLEIVSISILNTRGGLASSSASATVPDGIVGDVPSSSCAATSKGVAGQGEEATFPYHYSSDKGRKPFPLLVWP